jgi:hypothetical protein
LNRQQLAASKRADKLIDAYLDMRNTMADVCRIMGWNSERPNQMVSKEINRLRNRGYYIPYRSGQR